MPMTCKEAIAAWEKDKNEVAADAEVVELQFRWPPIEKMDGALSTLAACKKLSLSTNMIDKIAGIAGMRNLKILSLGRNYIKSLAGIETVADSLEELWISYNPIDKMKGIGSLKQLKVFYMANALIKEWVEFNRLQVFPPQQPPPTADCGNLRDLVFIGNPIMENQPDMDAWRTQASNRLPQITKLDGIPIIRAEED